MMATTALLLLLLLLMAMMMLMTTPQTTLSPVEKLRRDAKRRSHRIQADATIRLLTVKTAAQMCTMGKRWRLRECATNTTCVNCVYATMRA
jgi:hypothetical protein